MLAFLVDLDDVRMPETGDKFRLTIETSAFLLPRMLAGQEHLQGDDTVEIDLPGLLDHSHAAMTKFFEFLVIPLHHKPSIISVPSTIRSASFLATARSVSSRVKCSFEPIF